MTLEIRIYRCGNFGAKVAGFWLQWPPNLCQQIEMRAVTDAIVNRLKGMSNQPKNPNVNASVQEAMKQLLNQTQAPVETPAVDARDVSIPARILVAMRLIELMKGSQNSAAELMGEMASQFGPDALRMAQRAQRAQRAAPKRNTPERVTYVAAMEAVRNYVSGEHGFFDFTSGAQANTSDAYAKQLHDVLQSGLVAMPAPQSKPMPKKKSKAKSGGDVVGNGVVNPSLVNPSLSNTPHIPNAAGPSTPLQGVNPVEQPKPPKEHLN